MDFTNTYDRYDRPRVPPTGHLTHTRSSDGVPDPDGALRNRQGLKFGIMVTYI